MRLTNKKIISSQNMTYEVIPNYETNMGTYITTELLAINKLGQLEDIEEELGIDLYTIITAYFKGFYIKYKDNTIGYVKGGEYYLELCLETQSFRLKATNDKYYFSDYNKTWSLNYKE